MGQARKQFDGVEGTFGDPEFPNCEGLTMTQLGSLDWDQIDPLRVDGLATDHRQYAFSQ